VNSFSSIATSVEFWDAHTILVYSLKSFHMSRINHSIVQKRFFVAKQIVFTLKRVTNKSNEGLPIKIKTQYFAAGSDE
jgi:hypothetical protein